MLRLQRYHRLQHIPRAWRIAACAAICGMAGCIPSSPKLRAITSVQEVARPTHLSFPAGTTLAEGYHSKGWHSYLIARVTTPQSHVGEFLAQPLVRDLGDFPEKEPFSHSDLLKTCRIATSKRYIYKKGSGRSDNIFISIFIDRDDARQATIYICWAN